MAAEDPLGLAPLDPDPPKRVVTVPATLADMPVFYDYGRHPAVLSFMTANGHQVDIKLSMEDYEDLLERQLAALDTMRSDALK